MGSELRKLLILRQYSVKMDEFFLLNGTFRHERRVVKGNDYQRRKNFRTTSTNPCGLSSVM